MTICINHIFGVPKKKPGCLFFSGNPAVLASLGSVAFRPPITRGLALSGYRPCFTQCPLCMSVYIVFN